MGKQWSIYHDFLDFLWVTIDPLGSPGLFGPLGPQQKCPKIHITSRSSLFLDVNDKVRQTCGQNPPNFQTKSAKFSLSQLILAYIILVRQILSESLSDFVQKFGGFYLPHFIQQPQSLWTPQTIFLLRLASSFKVINTSESANNFCGKMCFFLALLQSQSPLQVQLFRRWGPCLIQAQRALGSRYRRPRRPQYHKRLVPFRLVF